MGTSHTAELDRAREVTEASRKRAREDLRRQQDLLAHEHRTVTVPLRGERVAVNHFSDLVRSALVTGYGHHDKGEPV